MCRLVAYLGPQIALERVILQPVHSLIVQSQQAREAKLSVNGDGFGIAWYGTRPDPGLYKDMLPAWSDGNLLSLCQHIASALFMAHVRASTEGETARANCHPFTHGRWSFMHNGQTGDFHRLRRVLEGRLSDDLYALRRGTTDSELLFLLLLRSGLEQSPEVACQRMIALLRQTAEAAGLRCFYRLTCVLSDGQRIYCFRASSDGRWPTLYHSRTVIEGGLVIASEPLEGAAETWMEIAPEQLVCFGASEATTSYDLSAA